MTQTVEGEQMELMERPGDPYAAPVGPIIRLYPRNPIKIEKGSRPATDEERRAITAPVLERIRQAKGSQEAGERAAAGALLGSMAGLLQRKPESQ